MESADAEALAVRLQAMLPPERKGVKKIFIQADPATNSVLLRAPEAERKALEETIAQLDQATQETARELRIFTIEHASAQELVQMLGQLYGGAPAPARRRGQRGGQVSMGDQVIIAAGPGDRTLIVDAPRPKVEQIAELISMLDAEGGMAHVRISTYQLTNANAKELAQSLGRLYGGRQQPRGKGQPATAEIQPRFEADSTTNQLIVAATDSQFEEIEKVIEQLRSAAVATGQMRTYELKFAESSEMAKLLGSMLGGAQQPGRRGAKPGTSTRVKVATLTGSNTIVVQGSPDELALAEELIRQFDMPDTSGKASIEIVRLVNAQAQTLAQAVNAAMGPGRGAAPRRRRDAQPAPVGERLTVTPEPNSNAILVRGPADEVAQAVALIKTLDADATSANVQMRVYALKNSEAKELAVTLQVLFGNLTARIQRGQRARPQQTTASFSVVANEATNSLIISTTSAQFALVEKLLADLDKAPERAAMDVAYVWLENANAFDVGSKLVALFEGRPKGERPMLEADLSTNALTVIAKPEDLIQIEQIIAKLDEAARDNNIRFRVVPVPVGRAERLAEILQRVYGQMSGKKVIITDKLPSQRANPDKELPYPAVGDSETQPAVSKKKSAVKGAVKDDRMFEPAPPVTIAVDPDAGALIVSGTRRDLDNIESLISQLATAEVEGEAQIYVIPIKHADPAGIAQVLNDVFNPRTPSRSQSAAKPTKTPSKDEKGEPAKPSPPPPAPTPVKQKIIIVPDARTKNIIVWARPSDFEMLAALVERLDTSSTIVSELRIFSMESANAEEIARNVRDILQLPGSETSKSSTKGKSATKQKQEPDTPDTLELQIEGKMTKLDASESITVTANRDTNSVIVVAPADSMEVIAQLIERLDVPSQIEEVRLIQLNNIDPELAAEKLRSIFAKGPKRPRKGAPAQGILIEADSESGLLMVRTDDETFKRIHTLAIQLDTTSPPRGKARIIHLKNADPTEGLFVSTA
ncbi:MAG: secretin N-terminal domain-containing protein [Planctomycetota bacterium]|jgi:type II secretory pathway component GspD/PulD (secretin)